MSVGQIGSGKHYGQEWDYGAEENTPDCILGNLNVQGYVNEVLDTEAIPFLQRHGPGTMQQDYARPHTAGPSCSKLTTSLVNESLKFTSSDTQIC